MLREILSFLTARAGDTYNYLTDGEVSYGSQYSVLRHSRPFIVYRGIKTGVDVTILGENPLPKDRRVFLQRRGYRTGLFGWTVGGLMGGSKLPGIEVTPTEEQQPQLSVSPKLQNEIDRLLERSIAEIQKPQQTMTIHIPVSSGDGYFRLRITNKDPKRTLAESPTFRVGSISFSSSCPQGATVIGLVPELLVRSLFIAGKTAAYASFYTAFPLLKIAEYTPGPWRQYALQTLYSYSLSEDQRAQVSDNISRGREQLRGAGEGIYRKIPFGTVGVRTTADLEKDEELGRAGSSFIYANLS